MLSRIRLKGWAIWGGFALVAAASGLPAAQPKAGKVESIETLRKRCPTTRNLAPEAFARKAGASAAELDRWEQRIRGSLRAEGPPPNAPVVLRAFAGGSMTQSERSETATLLWRLPDGSWHFVAANHYPNRIVSPPPPPATLTQEQIEAARRSIGGGALDRGQAAALDALLADPCLEAEAEVVAGELPLLHGMPPMGPCYDAVPHTVELVRSGRRKVFVQTCTQFLAGELIGIALSPRQKGTASAPPSRTLASAESARLFADRVLGAAYGREAWANATDAAGSYVLVHRHSGFRCSGSEPYEVEFFGPRSSDTAVHGASCYRNSSRRVRDGFFKTEWRVVRGKGTAEVRRRVREAADGWFSSYHGSAAPRRIRTGKVKLAGLRMARAEVAGEPKIDARDDELTVVLGAEHDGWILVSRATGSAADPAAVQAAALREWRQAVETRGTPRK
jgi:hypothetical protein